MKISLAKKPKAPTIILGFPGIGLVGPIVTEFLIDHMKTSQIGVFEYDELPATAAIHKGELVHPMSLHYSHEHNILILYTILNIQGHEWEVAKQIVQLAKELKAKEIISIDGANTVGEEKEPLFGFGNEKLTALGVQPLQESVITGVTGSLLLTREITCIFAGTHDQLPNSKAAASVAQLLDKYLKLGVDSGPLLKQAEMFEQKLKTLMTQSEQAISEQERKKMDYLG